MYAFELDIMFESQQIYDVCCAVISSPFVIVQAERLATCTFYFNLKNLIKYVSYNKIFNIFSLIHTRFNIHKLYYVLIINNTLDKMIAEIKRSMQTVITENEYFADSLSSNVFGDKKPVIVIMKLVR